MRIFSSRGWLATRFVLVWALVAWMLCILYRLAMVLLDNNPLLSANTWSAFVESVIVGARFDWAVIAILWLVPFVLVGVPGVWSPMRRRWIVWLSRIALIVLAILLVTDSVFFLAYGSHAGLELFSIQYWSRWYGARTDISVITVLLNVAIIIGIYWLMRPIERSLVLARGHWHQGVLVIVLLALMLRGGVTSRPLHVVDAFRGDNPQSAMYAINGVYVSLREALSGQKERLPRELFELAYERRDPGYRCNVVKRYVNQQRDTHQQPPNFVIVMLNGWRNSNINTDGVETVEFDQLARRAWAFNNAYSSGYGAQVGVYSVLTGSPPLGGTQQLAWGLANDRVPRVGYLLETRDYSSMLAHAYDPQYLRLDLLTDSLGIEFYLTQDDLPHTFDPKTGENVAQRDALWDGVLEFADQVRGPFAAYIITPWLRVDGSKKSILVESQRRQISDIDAQLGDFIRRANERAWGRNTVFILVGVDNSAAGQLGLIDEDWKIPLILMGRGIVARAEAEAVGSVAILPTIIDMAGVDRPFASSAESVFKQQHAPTVIMQPPLVVGVNNDGYVRIAAQRTMDASAFNPQTEASALEALEADTLNQLNCMWQRYEIFESDD